jgi:disease resistance protein RPS2
VEGLVEMWIGEGMVNNRDTSLIMDEGRRYVKLLVERCLFEYVDGYSYVDGYGMKYIKVHDIVRDMALYIAEKEGKCLFRTSQKLDEFPPAEEVKDDCKRIAIRYYNDTAFLPTDLRCPELRTLILARNEGLREVPNDFLLNLTSLRVLDLSYTRITSLPDSMWQLTQLEFVGLNDTNISSCLLTYAIFLDCNFCFLAAV